MIRINSYNQKNIVLNAVGYAYNRFWGTRLLQKLSDMTGGTYYQVDDISQLSGTMSQAASSRTPERNLLSYRYGLDRKNAVSLIERILFIALLIAATCVVLGLAAGEKDVGMFYLPQKAIYGGIAGLILELGLLAFTPEPLVRLAVSLLMGLFLATHRRLLETCHTEGQVRATKSFAAVGGKTSAGSGIGVGSRPS